MFSLFKKHESSCFLQKSKTDVSVSIFRSNLKLKLAKILHQQHPKSTTFLHLRCRNVGKTPQVLLMFFEPDTEFSSVHSMRVCKIIDVFERNFVGSLKDVVHAENCLILVVPHSKWQHRD